MIELISYCVIGGCLLWIVGLALYLFIESANDVADLEEICHQHARREWQKKKCDKHHKINQISFYF